MLSTFTGCGLGAVLFMKLAHRYGLHDHPTGRSSHHSPTVTGMGILVVLAVLIYVAWQFIFKHESPLPLSFLIGFILLTGISFLDDMFFLKHSLRLVFQCVAAILLVYSFPFQSNGIEYFLIGIASVVFSIGVINSYNFMDGINGMLSLHSLLVLTCFAYLNQNLKDESGVRITFTSLNFILSVAIPMAIFSFFNIRKKALAFIGDVGSVGIAFIIMFLMGNLLLTTGNYTYLLLFSTFGADAGLTVIYKLILRENIFVPHRDFLFKKLVHRAKLPHIKVSFYYFLVQAIINIIVIALPQNLKPSLQLSVLFIAMTALVTLYIIIQNRLSFRKNS